MFERYGIHDDARQLMLNVSPNLMTIERKNVNQQFNSGQPELPDKKFEEINQRQEHLDINRKIMILKHYEGIYH
jgi:hypothetical protein